MLGGARASRPECGDGWFVEPTIFTGVNNRMRIAQEEVFGPVMAVIPFKDEEEAIAIGNDVVYGLAAGVWTQSIRRALMMAERLQAGTVWVNTYRTEQLHVAVRRLQAVRLRARGRPGHDLRVSADQERLDLDGHRRAESVHAALEHSLDSCSAGLRPARATGVNLPRRPYAGLKDCTTPDYRPRGNSPTRQPGTS